MSIKETHKGYVIVIEHGETTAGTTTPINDLGILTIDNRPIDVSEVEPGRFLTGYLPYTTYDTTIALAKAVIDHTADFDTLPGHI